MAPEPPDAGHGEGRTVSAPGAGSIGHEAVFGALLALGKLRAVVEDVYLVRPFAPAASLALDAGHEAESQLRALLAAAAMERAA